MEITPESIKDQIPYYLTENQRTGLIKALNDFPENANYYLDNFNNQYQNDVLQGDGWTNLRLRRFEDGEEGKILGIILSNTCDVSPENRRDLPTNITFAPIIPLSRYISSLQRASIGPKRINDKIDSIRQQKVSNIFFLPKGISLEEDCIVPLDQIYTMPTKLFIEDEEKSKIFTLSMIGFYLFVFKLSIHFCRFHENIDRGV